MTRLIILLMLCTVPAFAGDKAGTTAVKQANDKIAALLKQKPAPGSKEERALATRVTTSVRDFLDIDELGKRAMVDQWKKLSAAQQNEFLSTLRALIEDNDVKSDGVGLVENYRTQFNKIIQKDGFAGLIAKMKKKQSAPT